MDMPSCDYTVRRDSPNGAIVKAAQVGDLVYHRWECQGNMGRTPGFVCLMIMSCVLRLVFW